MIVVLKLEGGVRVRGSTFVRRRKDLTVRLVANRAMVNSLLDIVVCYG